MQIYSIWKSLIPDLTSHVNSQQTFPTPNISHWFEEKKPWTKKEWSNIEILKYGKYDPDQYRWMTTPTDLWFLLIGTWLGSVWFWKKDKQNCGSFSSFEGNLFLFFCFFPVCGPSSSFEEKQTKLLFAQSGPVSTSLAPIPMAAKEIQIEFTGTDSFDRFRMFISATTKCQKNYYSHNFRFLGIKRQTLEKFHSFGTDFWKHPSRWG